MKTISQIQQEVLATAQVTLDELQASIEKFWEEGWERNEEAKRTCQSSKWYANNISRVIRDYASYKNLYEKILSFDLISFKGQQGNYVGEWVIRTEDARYIFKTSCILAGGYNIQCLHTRYIANLKQVKK